MILTSAMISSLKRDGGGDYRERYIFSILLLRFVADQLPNSGRFEMQMCLFEASKQAAPRILIMQQVPRFNLMNFVFRKHVKQSK